MLRSAELAALLVEQAYIIEMGLNGSVSVPIKGHFACVSALFKGNAMCVSLSLNIETQ